MDTSRTASSSSSGIVSGLLATIYFQAIGPGTSMVQFTRASVRGADARKLPAMFQPTVIQVEE